MQCKPMLRCRRRQPPVLWTKELELLVAKDAKNKECNNIDLANRASRTKLDMVGLHVFWNFLA